MKSDESRLSVDIELRIRLADQIAIGPGKAQLLASIERNGSIAGACREMGMSYKHAWLLVDSMNDCFRGPLVEAVKGGKAGGGAKLTALGCEVLASYLHMQARAIESIRPQISALRRRMREE
jgi:molybdate transport system regulatory protein